MRRRVISAALAAAMALSVFAACSKKTESSQDAGTPSAGAVSDTYGSGGATAAPEGAVTLTPRKLYFFPSDDGSQPAIRGIWISGNRAGSGEFNTKTPANDGLRCIFELNEYVEFYLDTDSEDNIEVWAFKHKADQNEYLNETYSTSSEEIRGFCALQRPEDDPSGCWGSFYLNPEEAEPGLYDIVFTCRGVPVVSMLARFYNQDELSEKSDAELESMMSSIG